jgi:hypothetical protein
MIMIMMMVMVTDGDKPTNELTPQLTPLIIIQNIYII